MLSKLFRLFLLVPMMWWIYSIFFGDLGAEPVKELNHQTGEVALYMLLLNGLLGAGLDLCPKQMRPFRFMLMHRRYLGVLTFFYLIAHLFFYVALESFEWIAIEQLWTKVYLSLAISAWSLLLILWITSNDFSVRKLGQKTWRLVHRLVYLAMILVSGHVLLIEKTDLVKYSLIFGVFTLIQFVRLLIYLKTKVRTVSTVKN